MEYRNTIRDHHEREKRVGCRPPRLRVSECHKYNRTDETACGRQARKSQLRDIRNAEQSFAISSLRAENDKTDIASVLT